MAGGKLGREWREIRTADARDGSGIGAPQEKGHSHLDDSDRRQSARVRVRNQAVDSLHRGPRGRRGYGGFRSELLQHIKCGGPGALDRAHRAPRPEDLISSRCVRDDAFQQVDGVDCGGKAGVWNGLYDDLLDFPCR